MTRYSTSFEFSNLKNSLKSGGNRIVAIDDLPHELERFHAMIPFYTGRFFPTRKIVRLRLTVFFHCFFPTPNPQSLIPHFRSPIQAAMSVIT